MFKRLVCTTYGHSVSKEIVATNSGKLNIFDVFN